MNKKLWGFAAACGLVCAGLLLAVQVNALFDFVKVSAPSNPAAGMGRLYVDSGTNKVSCLNSDGSSCMPASSGFIQTLTAPSSGSFTAQNFNTGAGVATTQVNNSSPVTSITILQHDPNGTNNMAAIDKAKIAATFTLTEAISFAGGGNVGFAGLWLSDGGSPPNNLTYGYQAGATGGLVAFIFTNFTAFSSSIFGIDERVPTGPLTWLRIQETGANRIFSFSTDGITFAQVASEAVGTHFTTSRYGFVVSDRTASANSPDNIATLYSFTESNP